MGQVKHSFLDKEIKRQKEMHKYEHLAYQQKAQYIAGIDEVGRGPLAGPVVSCAVVLPKDIFIPYINDSKKLSSKKREELFEVITQKAICYGIGVVGHQDIDMLGIAKATRNSMKMAVQALTPSADFLLIDAEKLDSDVMQLSIIKGDCLSISIAAASIIAKVTRDRMMVEEDKKYPQYGFAKHKGYGTKQHIENINKFGLCPIHRKTFAGKFSNYQAN